MFLLFLSLICLASCAIIPIDHISNNKIIDVYGRERIFHGVNVVYKGDPWHPKTSGFTWNDTFTETDAHFLKSIGLNVVRLGIMWPGVEPSQNEYNYTYLGVMKEIVDICSQYDIYVILDFHQDLLSNKFCGEGVPNWLINTTNSETSFPFPIGFSYKSDIPSESECQEKAWASYYASLNVGESFKKLYTDEYTVDKFINFWKVVVTYFKNLPNVIAYELINEPWAGDIYKNPFLLLPGMTDKSYLEPLYNKLYSAIREIDPHTLIMFESITWDLLNVGFDQTPGNDNSKSILSYHCYLPPNYSVKQTFSSRMSDIRRLRCGGFCTEFEFGSGTNQDIVNANILFEMSDLFFQSWAIWQYKSYFNITGDMNGFYNPDGSLTPTADLVNRMYPMAICGNTMLFEYNKRNMTLIYVNNPNCQSNTEIYIKDATKINIIPTLHYIIAENILYIIPFSNISLVTVNIS